MKKVIVHATTAKIKVTKRYMHLWHEFLAMKNVLVNILVTVLNWPIIFWIVEQRATRHHQFQILFQVHYKIRINTLKLRTDITSQRKKSQVWIQTSDNNGDPFIATLHNVLLEPDLCDRSFSIIMLMNLAHTCLFHKGFWTVYFGSKEKNAVDLFQPKTDLFSTRALIWVHFKTVHYFSQPIFSLFSYFKNA